MVLQNIEILEKTVNLHIFSILRMDWINVQETFNETDNKVPSESAFWCDDCFTECLTLRFPCLRTCCVLRGRARVVFAVEWCRHWGPPQYRSVVQDHANQASLPVKCPLLHLSSAWLESRNDGWSARQCSINILSIIFTWWTVFNLGTFHIVYSLYG